MGVHLGSHQATSPLLLFLEGEEFVGRLGAEIGGDDLGASLQFLTYDGADGGLFAHLKRADDVLLLGDEAVEFVHLVLGDKDLQISLGLAVLLLGPLQLRIHGGGVFGGRTAVDAVD